MSEDFRSRLRRLRREPTSNAPSSPEAEEGLPAWVRGRLARKQAIAAQSRLEASPRDLHPASLEPLRDLEVREGSDGPVVARHTLRAAREQHGTWRLEEAFAVEPDTIALLSGDPTLEGIDLERAIFLDTETTGLSGGAGVYVYMVGLGAFERDEDNALRLRVWQGFLREPAEERALLAEVAERIEAGSSLVSFFGKSFDRHRLEDKMRIAGVTPPFAERPHLDLYHPLQRLTQGAYVDGRLATLESSLVGVERASDLPGAYAPEAWFDFLAGRPHRLEGVFQHNLDDVLSLVTLAAYLGRVHCGERPCGARLEGPPGRRARALARALAGCQRREQALPWFDTALESERTPEELSLSERRELAFERAEILRKLRRFEEAESALEVLAAAPLDLRTPAIHEARAKLFEHGSHDLDRALAATEAALAAQERLPRRGSAVRFTLELVHRRDRLRRRLEPSSR